jgi:hypothetical protein
MESGGKRSSAMPSGAGTVLPAATRGLLVILPVILPFEAPLFRLGPLLITTAELALYAFLGTWLAAVLLARGRAPIAIRFGWSALAANPIASAVALWLAVVVISAVAAPSHRGAAFKFSLRTLSGVLLFFAAKDLLRIPGLARRVALAIVVGALLSGVTGLVDGLLPDAGFLWRPFRAGHFVALGLPRATGVFAYPTIAAMYWEAALPLLVVAPFGSGKGLDRSSPWVGGAAVTAAAGVLVGAMLFSATRTALAMAAVTGAAMLILCWRGGGPRIRRAAGGALALTALLIGLTFVPGRSDSLLAQRLHWWRDDAWFRADYTVSQNDALVMRASRMAAISVMVHNGGALTWPHEGNNPVQLSYHWERRDATGTRLVLDGRRTRLPRDVPPDATVSLLAAVRVPSRPGRYRLRWDMVCEDVTWFSQRGNPTADQVVDVVSDGRRGETHYDDSMVAGTLEDWVSSLQPTRPELWLAALRLWRRHPLLGVGPDNFRRLYPEVIAPARRGRQFDDQRMHANSLYLETLADLGLVGAVALALLMVQILSRARGHAAAGRLLPLAAAVALGTFFMHGVLDYFLEFTPSYGLYWLLLAFVAAGENAHTAPPSSTRS